MHIELVIAKLVTIGLGLTIAAKAYQGYRHYGSQPMRYVAIGFLLISVGSVIEGILYDVVGLSIFLAGTIQTGIVALGMVIVLYSLYGQFPERSGGEIER